MRPSLTQSYLSALKNTILSALMSLSRASHLTGLPHQSPEIFYFQLVLLVVFCRTKSSRNISANMVEVAIDVPYATKNRAFPLLGILPPILY